MQDDNTHERGRPAEVAPAGYMTMTEAVAVARVSYATIYRHVKRGHVRSDQAENGTIYVKREDVAKIKPVKRKRSKKPSVTIRLADAEHLQRWQMVAGDVPVAKWLVGLADKATARAERAGA